VVPWFTFVDLVHSNVNPLAGEEHMKELMQQLKIMGEVCVFLQNIVCYGFRIKVKQCTVDMQPKSGTCYIYAIHSARFVAYL
jgi:hypothetical protein